MIDTKAIEEHIRGILVALGDDPDREGLRETPQRMKAGMETQKGRIPLMVPINRVQAMHLGNLYRIALLRMLKARRFRKQVIRCMLSKRQNCCGKSN